jgi:hypothetical protein
MTRGSQPITGHGWQARIDGSKVVLSLSGNWTTHEIMSGFRAAASLLLQPNVEAVGFDITCVLSATWTLTDANNGAVLSGAPNESRRRARNQPVTRSGG